VDRKTCVQAIALAVAVVCAAELRAQQPPPPPNDNLANARRGVRRRNSNLFRNLAPRRARRLNPTLAYNFRPQRLVAVDRVWDGIYEWNSHHTIGRGRGYSWEDRLRQLYPPRRQLIGDRLEGRVWVLVGGTRLVLSRRQQGHPVPEFKFDLTLNPLVNYRVVRRLFLISRSPLRWHRPMTTLPATSRWSLQCRFHC